MYSITPQLYTAPCWMNLARGDMNYNTSRFTQVTTTHQNNTDVTILTLEGDRVTLSSSSQSQATYIAYDSLALSKGRLTRLQGEIFGLNTNDELSISVDGDLNKQELKDIAKAIKAIGTIIRDFLYGNIGYAVAKALKIIGLESIVSLEASMQCEQTVSLGQLSLTDTASSSPELAEDTASKGNNAIVSEHIGKVTDRIAEVIKESGVRPRRLRKPIRKLFSHLFRELSQENTRDSLKVAIAKLITSNLADKIKDLSEAGENNGNE
jgi:predicted RNase H-related nuclease YkuK (DUF458 family)